MEENNLYIHNVDLVDPVDLDPQFYFTVKNYNTKTFHYIFVQILGKSITLPRKTEYLFVL